MTRVYFVPDGPGLELVSGERLLDALDERELTLLPTACRGATCGTCLVRVMSGAERLEAAGEWERETLREMGAGEGERLGCQVVVAAEGAGEVVLGMGGRGGA